MKLQLPKLRSPLSKVDFILLLALGQIGSGVYLQLGAGPALLCVGSLLLLLGLAVARGKGADE